MSKLSLKCSNLLLDNVSALLEVELDSLVRLELGEGLCGNRLAFLLLGFGAGADGFVGSRVHVLEILKADSVLDVLRELTLVGFLIFVLEDFHVFGNVAAKDVAAEHFSVELLGFVVESRESVL